MFFLLVSVEIYQSQNICLLQSFSSIQIQLNEQLFSSKQHLQIILLERLLLD